MRQKSDRARNHFGGIQGKKRGGWALGRPSKGRTKTGWGRRDRDRTAVRGCHPTQGFSWTGETGHGLLGIRGPRGEGAGRCSGGGRWPGAKRGGGPRPVESQGPGPHAKGIGQGAGAGEENDFLGTGGRSPRRGEGLRRPREMDFDRKRPGHALAGFESGHAEFWWASKAAATVFLNLPPPKRPISGGHDPLAAWMGGTASGNRSSTWDGCSLPGRGRIDVAAEP